MSFVVDTKTRKAASPKVFLCVTSLVRQVAAVAGAEDDPLCEMCTQFVTDLKTYVSSDQGRAYFTNMINQVNMSGY